MINVASFLSISLQPSGFYSNTVGYRQDVICSLPIPPGVDPDTIELGWVNEDDIITDDGRVTIDTSSDYYNDSGLVSIIQFDPLFEEDEGEYICYAVINGSFIFEPINLQYFTSKKACSYIYTYVHTYYCSCTLNNCAGTYCMYVHGLNTIYNMSLQIIYNVHM